MGPRALKAVSMLLRVLQLLLALFIVGVASYHTYQFSNNHLRLTDDSPAQLPRALYAVLVISCVAALYSFFTLITTCLGHKKFFIFAVVSDLLLTCGFIVICVLLRGSTKQNCTNINYSGTTSKGATDIPSSLYSASSPPPANVRTTASAPLMCNLDKVSFALAAANTVFFTLTLLLSHLALRAYNKNRAFGPSPGNNYSTRPNGAHKSWAKPFHRASEETAYTNNTAMTGTTAGGGYDAPGYRGTDHAGYRGSAVVAPPPGSGGYRTPMTGTVSELESGAGRFDPALGSVGGVERGYGGRNF